MPISFKKKLAVLRGALDIEDAERLLSALEKDRERHVDLSDLESIHTAVLQVLIVMQPVCAALPKNEALASVLEPLLPKAGNTPAAT